MSVMSLEEPVELKFRLYDGTDIGPNKYAPATTVANIKESILNHWPKEKQNGPKTINDLKLINAGKILENSKTLADSRVILGKFLDASSPCMLSYGHLQMIKLVKSNSLKLPRIKRAAAQYFSSLDAL